MVRLGFVQALFEAEICKLSPLTIQKEWRESQEHAASHPYFFKLFEPFDDHLFQFDEKISQFLKKPWDQSDPVLRAVLRAACAELNLETPWRVVVNEYVDLAKRLQGQGDGDFVNAILDKIVHIPSAKIGTQ